VKPPKHPDVGLFLESGKSGLEFFVKHDPSLVFGFAYPADRAKFKLTSFASPAVPGAANPLRRRNRLNDEFVIIGC
jgi:hypothetical protein